MVYMIKLERLLNMTLQSKIIFYDLFRNPKDLQFFLENLPNNLKIELTSKIHESEVVELYFFKKKSKEFIAYLAPLLKNIRLMQNDILYKEGDIIEESILKFLIKFSVFCS